VTEPNKTAVNRGPDGRFLPGNNANPAGRPKKELSLTSLAKAMLEQKPERAQEIVERWLAQAIEGKTEARRDLQDRLEGRMPLPVQADVKMQGKVTFIIGKGYAGMKAEEKDATE